MLVEALLADLSKTSKVSPCLMKDPRGDATSLFSELVRAFPPAQPIDDLSHALWAGIEHVRSTGSSPIVIVDDAHLLSNAGAEIMGKLATGNRAQTLPVPVVLVGQPTLKRRLNLPDFRLLKAASGTTINLNPLSPDEVGPYINNRLQRAGAPPDNGIFEPETLPLISEKTAGVPRQINKLCEVCLFLAGESKAPSITAESLQQTLTIYNDMEVPGHDDGPPDRVARSDVIVLQEPERQQPSAETSRPTKTQPPTPASSARSTTGSAPVAKADKKTPPLGLAVAGLAVVAAIYVLSPFGPLPADNAAMVAIYGEQPTTNAVDSPDTAPSDLNEVETAQPTVATEEPESIPLPVPPRVYDPVKDPAEAYYEAAIASTSQQEIAIAYSRAAIRGHTRSALYLGQLFETGDGVVFAPDVAAQWYAVADNPAILDNRMPTGELSDNGTAETLFSEVENDTAEFVWQGNAAMFHLEIGDADGTALARLTTPLTAALIEIPSEAAQWRVITDADSTADWIPIAARRGD